MWMWFNFAHTITSFKIVKNILFFFYNDAWMHPRYTYITLIIHERRKIINLYFSLYYIKRGYERIIFNFPLYPYIFFIIPIFSSKSHSFSLKDSLHIITTFLTLFFFLQSPIFYFSRNVLNVLFHFTQKHHLKL